jgi:GLPGLI family protein
MKLLLSCLFALSFFVVNAQQKQGTIVYECKRNLWKSIRNEDAKKYVPEFRSTKYNLFFNDSISVFKLIPEVQLPDENSGGGSGMRMGFSIGGGGISGDGEMYKNYNTLKIVQSTDFMGKNFLIEDSIIKMRWKITKETKTIAGQNCYKAISKTTQQIASTRRVSTSSSINEAVTGKTDTTLAANNATREVEIIAWFASTIQAPIGPDKYAQLPGAILEVDIDGGTTVYTTLEIKESVSDKDLKEPKKGKKVTRKEYNETVQEVFKNMGGTNGQPMIIRRGM